MNKNFRFAGAVLAMCLSAQSMAQSSTSLPPAVQVSQIAIDDAGHPLRGLADLAQAARGESEAQTRYDLREISSREKLCDTILDKIVDGVRAERAAFVIGRDLVQTPGVSEEYVTAWLDENTPDPAASALDCDRADPFFPLRLTRYDPKNHARRDDIKNENGFPSPAGQRRQAPFTRISPDIHATLPGHSRGEERLTCPAPKSNRGVVFD